MKLCPCCSGRQFVECCEPKIKRGVPARTPEELMRSRYTAFATVNADYLIKTSSELLRREQTKKSITQWAQENTWTKLEVVHCAENGEHGSVEFKAYYTDHRGVKQVHHEASKFMKEGGCWVYSEGKVKPNLLGKSIKRNDSCPCGSGKKYKKCCG